MRSLLLFAFALPLLVMGQANFPASAKSTGLGGIYTTQADQWSAIQNQAGLGTLIKSSIGITGENRYALAGVNFFGLVCTKVLPEGALGFSIRQFGYKSYYQRVAGIAYGLQLAKGLYGGLKINYHQLRNWENVNTRYAVSADAGLLFLAGEKLRIGTHFTNINAGTYNRPGQSLPIKYLLGLQYSAAKNFFTSLEIEKESSHKAVVKAGAEYLANETVVLRYGIKSFPFINSFGFGYNHQQITVDISGVYDSRLGVSSSLSISYQFAGK